MGEDVARLDKRVDALQRHFHQAEEDVRQIRTSAEKIAKRSDRIAEVDLGDGEAALEAGPADPLLPQGKEPRKEPLSLEGEGLG